MDEIDRILVSEEALEPSSGFAASVMRAVRDTASELAPLPFPWWRFAIGVIACGLAAASGAALVRQLEASMLDLTAGEMETIGVALSGAAAVLLASLGALAIRRAFGRLVHEID